MNWLVYGILGYFIPIPFVVRSYIKYREKERNLYWDKKMKKVSMKKVEASKADKAMDKKMGYKEGSKADMKQDKKLQKKMSKK